jgi:hypothetical protein
MDLHCLRDSLLAYRLKIPTVKILALHNTSCFRSGDRLTVVGKTKHVLVKSLYCEVQVTLPVLQYLCLWRAPVHSAKALFGSALLGASSSGVPQWRRAVVVNGVV